MLIMMLENSSIVAMGTLGFHVPSKPDGGCWAGDLLLFVGKEREDCERIWMGMDHIDAQQPRASQTNSARSAGCVVPDRDGGLGSRRHLCLGSRREGCGAARKVQARGPNEWRRKLGQQPRPAAAAAGQQGREPGTGNVRVLESKRAAHAWLFFFSLHLAFAPL